MNSVTISVKDRTKTATCRETLSLCGQYAVRVEPAWNGTGFLVVHDRVMLPNVWPHNPGCDWAAPHIADGTVFTYAKLVNGNSEVDAQSGTPTSDGLLDLRDKELVRKLTKFIAKGGVGQIPYSVYAENGNGGMNMIGTGYMNILVAEAYSSKDGKSLDLFKGDPGADGRPGPKVTAINKTGEDVDGNWIYEFVFEDGSRYSVVVPRGAQGSDAFLNYVKEENTDAWHKIHVRQTSDGWVLLIDNQGETADYSYQEATMEANQYMLKAKWYAEGKFSDATPPVLLTPGAKQYCDRAETAADAAEDAQEAAETAAHGKDVGTESEVKGAEQFRDEAKDAQEAAETAAYGNNIGTASEVKGAEQFRDEAEVAKEDAETAAYGKNIGEANEIKGAEQFKDLAEAAKVAAVSAKEQTVSAATQALTDIGTAKTGALGDIGTAKTGALGDIGEAKTNALSAITSAQGTAVGAVESAQSSAIAAVNAAKQEGLDELEALGDAVHKSGDENIEGTKGFEAQAIFAAGILAKGMPCQIGHAELLTERPSTTNDPPIDVLVEGLEPSKKYALLFFVSTERATAPTVYIGHKESGATTMSTSYTIGTVSLYKHVIATRVLESNENGEITFSAAQSASEATKVVNIDYFVIPMFDVSLPVLGDEQQEEQ